MKQSLLDVLNLNVQNEEIDFFYESNASIINLLAIFSAMFLTKTHCKIEGPTGVGKTEFVKFFSQVKKGENGDSLYSLHSFHSRTKSADLYGSITLDNEEIKFKYGNLSDSIEKGKIFNADELNLSDPNENSSISVSLDPCLSKFLFLPNCGEFVEFNPNYFFVACQNDTTMNGRKDLLIQLKRRLKYLSYPKLGLNDISSICKQVIEKLQKLNENVNSKELSESIASFMEKFNGSFPHLKWSIRDLRIILSRINRTYSSPHEFQGFSPSHHILFYIFQSFSPSQIEDYSTTIFQLIQDNFGLDIHNNQV